MIKEYGIKDWNSFIQTINGLTWSLARELGPSNIRVNAVAPGITKTGCCFTRAGDCTTD